MERPSLRIWLIVCIALVSTIIIIGGYTRLSHSGLSIVEWKPIAGIVPPLDEPSWQAEFSQYKQSPEYKKINYGMELAEFKEIFLVEYLHRMLGRLLGIALLLPFLYFAFTKILLKQDVYYFTFVIGLVGLQGLIGWLMVKSGLINNPYVSQYRLALHLFMACVILSLLVWKVNPGLINKSKYAFLSYGLLLLQIVSGAFVAGLKAGLVYNSFPLMDGKIIPEGMLIMNPWYVNLFENVTTVQFIHRNLGIANVINLLIYSYYIRSKGSKKIALCLSALTLCQFILGILTLVLQVPISLALLHQAGAVALLITMVMSFKVSRE